MPPRREPPSRLTCYGGSQHTLTVTSPDDRSVRLVSLADVAELARVTRPAVSNWRRRYKDFPSPVQETGSVSLFRLEEIQTWLTKRGKRHVVPSARQSIWGAISGVRDSLTVARSVEVCMWVLGMYVLNGWVGPDGRLNATGSWSEESTDLVQSAARIVGEHFHGQSLEITDDEAWKASRVASKLRGLIRDHGIIEVCEGLLAEASERQGRASEAFVTPPSIVKLILSLAEPIGNVIYDPACGWGNFLLAAHHKSTTREPAQLIGGDIDQKAFLTAGLRMLVHGINISLGLREFKSTSASRNADLVFTDPPFTAKDEWWWIDQTVHHLNSTGRGFHLSPQGAVFRGGRETEARRRLVRKGMVEAVICLPGGLYPHTGVKVALWLLRPPSSPPPHEILLINGNELGSHTRPQVELTETDVSEIVRCHRSWLKGRDLPASGNMYCAAIPSDQLLDSDCQLQAPPREALRVNLADQIAHVRSASDELHHAATALAQPDTLVGLAETQDLTTCLLRDLGEVIRGVRIPAEMIGKGTTPVVGIGGLGDDWRAIHSTTVDLDQFDRDVPISRPGDLLVSTGTGEVRAAVEMEGGAVISAPLQCVRMQNRSMDRSLLLAALLEGQPHRPGWSPSYADIRDIEVPWPNDEICGKSADALRTVAGKRSAARMAMQSADNLVKSMVRALAGGAFPASTSKPVVNDG